MKQGKKLASRRGETLIETLVAILVVGLVSAGLAAMIAAAARLDSTAEQADRALYTAISAAEKGEGAADGQMTLTLTLPDGSSSSKAVPVTCWGSDGLYAYGKRATP